MMGSVLISDQSPQARVEQFLRQWARTHEASERLPSERELGRHLGVGRSTVRRALAAVSRQGLVEQRDGRRRVAGRDAVSESGPLLAQTVLMLMPALAGRDAQWQEYLTFGSVRAIRQAGYSVLSLNCTGKFEEQVRQLLAQRPVGVLLPEVFKKVAQTAAAAKLVAASGTPLVVYGGDPQLGEFDRVMSDHAAGSRMLTEYFLQRGCRRIVQVWPLPWDAYWMRDRQRGYEEAMVGAGLTPLATAAAAAVWQSDGSKKEFERQTRLMAGFLAPLLSGPGRPEVLLTVSDRAVAYTAAACRLFGKRPGVDVLIGGYDGYLELCEERRFEPAGATVTVNRQNQRMGEAMVKLLLERVRGELGEGPRTRVVAPQLELPVVGARAAESAGTRVMSY